MPTDFERELSALLHDATPEPPGSMAAPRVATLLHLSGTDADADADVIELSTATAPELARRHLWPTVLTAAAVAVLAASVVAIVRLGGNGHDPSANPPAGDGTPTPRSSVSSVPPCRNSQIVISQGPHVFATHGRAGTVQVTYRNQSPKRCELPLPSVAIGPTPSGGQPFPASRGVVPLASQARLVITARVQVAGQCQTVTDGLRINLSQGSWAYSWPLGVTGCTVTPLRLTHYVTR